MHLSPRQGFATRHPGMYCKHHGAPSCGPRLGPNEVVDGSVFSNDPGGNAAVPHLEATGRGAAVVVGLTAHPVASS
jgi:hypothetical protein